MISKIRLLTASIFLVSLSAFLFAPHASTQTSNAFTSSDIIEKNGFEWLRPDLFGGVTWNEILAVCPGGVCNNGTLNGYNMSGWNVARLDDMNELFYSYIQPYDEDSLYSPTPGLQAWTFNSYPTACWRWAGDVFDDGWQPTSEEGVNNRVQEQYIEGFYWGFYSDTNPGLCGLSAFTYFVDRDGICADGGVTNTYGACIGVLGDLSDPELGAWFYRPKCVGCGCPAG